MKSSKKSITPTVCNPSNTYMYSVGILSLIIMSFITYTLYNLEKKINCNCINNNNKTYLKEWCLFILIFNFIIIISYFITSYNCFSDYQKMLTSYYFPFFLILAVVNIIMLVRLFLYMLYLKNNCKCAYELKEKIIYWYTAIIFSFIILLLLILISLIIVSFISSIS